MEYAEPALHSTKIPFDAAKRAFHEMTEMAREVGFEHCSYTIKMPLPLSRPIELTFSSFRTTPAGAAPRPSWRQETIYCADTSAEAIECPTQTRTKTVRALGGAIGHLTFIRSIAPDGGDIAVNEERLDWLSSHSHDRMASLLAPQLMPEASVTFTKREKEILRWTADGKTVNEIADILEISARTVKFHINNALTKLDATNKLQAVVKATALGLLL